MNNPLQELSDVREQARKANDPLAEVVYISTVGADGYPATRPVFSREITDDGVCLYLSELSPKFEQMMATRKVGLTFHWQSIGRVVRLNGDAEVVPNAGMQKHWPSRHPQARALAYFYEQHQKQSSAMTSRDALSKGIERLAADPAVGKEPPRSWHCVLVRPIRIEHWISAGESRLHERYLYERKGNDWQRSLLVP